MIRSKINRFPYVGTFTRRGESANGSVYDSTLTTVLTTDINILGVSIGSNEFVKDAKYKVLFNMPLDDEGHYETEIKDGDLFSCLVNGKTIQGQVKGFYPARNGDIMVYIIEMNN